MKSTLYMLLGAIILTYFTLILPFSKIYNSGLFEVLSFWLILIFVFSYNNKNHLIASIFKGSGDIDNLVPMSSQINRSGGKWYEMEQRWLKALRADPPKHVEVSIEPIYKDDSLRPDSFVVEYNIGKRSYLEKIKNQPGG